MKEEVMNEIEETFSNLIRVLTPITEKQLNTIPFPGSWTAGQVAEHIIKSIGGVPDSKTKPGDRKYDEKIDAIRKMFLDMNQKFKTAPFLEPEKDSHDKNEILAELSRLREQHLLAAKSKDLTVLCVDMELPFFGYLTRYEWLRFMMVHTQRHTLQLENIKKYL